jgi:hypothetical protein
MDCHVPIEMGVFVVRVWAKRTLEILFTGVNLQMALQVWFLVEFFLANLALELRWTVVDLVILEATFSAENLWIDS